MTWMNDLNIYKVSLNKITIINGHILNCVNKAVLYKSLNYTNIMLNLNEIDISLNYDFRI